MGAQLFLRRRPVAVTWSRDCSRAGSPSGRPAAAGPPAPAAPAAPPATPRSAPPALQHSSFCNSSTSLTHSLFMVHCFSGGPDRLAPYGSVARSHYRKSQLFPAPSSLVIETGCRCCYSRLFSLLTAATCSSSTQSDSSSCRLPATRNNRI